MNQRVAIVSGIGMDSKTITHLLLERNYHVILTYRRNTSQNIEDVLSLFYNDLSNNVGSKLSTSFMDITDLSSVRNCIDSVLKTYGKIDEFYNLAAQSHVGDSFKNALYTLQASGVAVFHILDCLRELSPTTKFFQASTSEMFGGDPLRSPFNEKTPFECRSPYAISKRLAYDWVLYFRQTHNMFASSLFTFNHSNIYRNRAFYIRKITNSAARITLGKQHELYLGNINHWRDESWADYCCEAMINCLQLPEPQDFVVGNGKCYHGEQYLDEAFNYFNLDWKKFVKFDNSLVRPNEVEKLEADSSLAQEKLGWICNRIDFKTHIALMAKFDFELESGQNPSRPNVFKMFP